MTSLHEMFQQYKEEDEITVLPQGSYELTVTGCGSRKDAVTPVFKVASGPYQGKKVMAGVFSCTERSRSIFFRNMAGFGLDEGFFANVADFKGVADALVGRTVQVEIIEDEWKGDPRNKIPIGAIKLVSAPSAIPGTAAAPAVAPVAAPQPAPVATQAPPVAAPQPAPSVAPAPPAPAPAPAAPQPAVTPTAAAPAAPPAPAPAGPPAQPPVPPAAPAAPAPVPDAVATPQPQPAPQAIPTPAPATTPTPPQAQAAPAPPPDAPPIPGADPNPPF